MNWWRRLAGWTRLTLLEWRLARGGYRRLHREQVIEATERSRRVIHDLADAVIILRSVAEQVEQALEEMGEDWND